MTPTEELVTQLAEIVKSSKEFVIDQSPDVARQLVTMQIVNGITVPLTALILVYLMNKWRAWILKEKVDEIIWFPFCIIGVGVLVVCGSGFCELTNAIEAVVAPKAFLLEYLLKHK